ncbi:MAG TPA: prepilin peptidase [Stellaceae bacterium]|jgi:prepilin peptidase CpaA
MTPSTPHLLVLGGFAALTAAAAFEDFRRRVIPNPIVLGLCVLWLMRLMVAPAVGSTAAAAAIGAAGAIFLAGALLFSRGFVGGGDVKLMAAATLWAGAGAVPALLLVTALLGGFLSIVYLTPLGVRVAIMRSDVPQPTGAVARPAGIPYGVAIAAAALIVTLPPQLG